MPAGNETVSLGDKASRAAAWLTAQTLYTKAATLFLQLILARLLLREDFGLYGLALTVNTFAALFHQAGIQEVLIARQRTFDTWANVAFWLSLTMGIVAFVVTLALAPLAANFYRCDEPEKLARLISVLAVVFPIGAAGAISRAKLQVQTRFRDLAIIGAVQVSVDVPLKILFAYLGYGAFSFAYAIIIATLVSMVLCIVAAPIRVRLNPQFRRWKYLMRTGGMVVAAMFLYWLIEEGDYIVLGRFEDIGVVGLYFFAFKISRHVVSVLAFQISRVLFPALSSLPTEADRQVNAFVRAARVVAVVAMPGCVAMAAIAAPMVQLLFEPRWYASIPLIQVMCLGMTLRTISWPAASLMQAQGRFKTRMFLAGFSALVFFPVTILGTWVGSALGLAIAVACFYSVFALIDVSLAVRPSRRTWEHLRSVFFTPVVGNVSAALPAVAIAYLGVPRLGLLPAIEQVVQIVLTLAVGGIIYCAMVRWLSPTVWRDTVQRLYVLLPVKIRERISHFAGT